MDGDLASFVEHATSVVAANPSLSRRTTDLRITLPLLRTLGWDVHGSEVVAEYRVQNTEDESVTVDFALLLDGEPAVFVVTAGLDSAIERDHGTRLEAAMAAAGVEYGTIAAGDTFVLVAGGVDDSERVQCSLADLPDRQSVLARFSRAATRRRRERDRAPDRRDAAKRLADRREAVASAVGECLADDVPDPVRTELRVTGRTVVDGVVSALASGDHPTSALGGAGPVAADSSSSPPTATDDGTEPTGGGSSDPGGEAAETTGSTTPATDASEPDGGTGSAARASGAGRGTGGGDPVADESGNVAGGDDPEDESETEQDDDRARGESGSDDGDEEEYVVRFFDGSNSVGAVGHGTSPGALVQALEYLAKRRGLKGNVELPWGPSEDRAVLNHDPVHPDGAEMVDAAQLSNGYYVCTTIGPSAIQEALSEIADATGLRVMFQGDW